MTIDYKEFAAEYIEAMKAKDMQKLEELPNKLQNDEENLQAFLEIKALFDKETEEFKDEFGTLIAAIGIAIDLLNENKEVEATTEAAGDDSKATESSDTEEAVEPAPVAVDTASDSQEALEG